jgi:hypothetical protein
MHSRYKGRELFLFELIRQFFPEVDDPGAPAPLSQDPETAGQMILIAALFLSFALIFGVLSSP